MPHWYRQEQPTSCVAACVRIVLSGYGVFCDEAEVRQWLGQPRLGITLGAAQTRLAKTGVQVEWYDDWNLDDLRDALRQGWHPIIGVERQLFGTPAARHAIVLVSLTSQTVQALDPYDGPQPQKYGTQTFERAWRLAGQEALLILAPSPPGWAYPCPRQSPNLPQAA